MIEKVDIDLGDVRYPIFVGPGLISQVPKYKSDLGIKGQTYIIIDALIHQNHSQEIQALTQMLYKVQQ